MFRKFFLAAAAFIISVTTAAAGEVNLKEKFPDQLAKLEEALRNLAQGNERSAEVTKAVIDDATGEVTVEMKVRSRQVSGKVPLTNKPIVAYDWTVEGKGNYNPRKGTGDAEFDLGRGIKIKASEVAKLLAGAK